MRQVRWDVSIKILPPVGSERSDCDWIENRMLTLKSYDNDLVIGFVRYKLLPIKEAAQWQEILYRWCLSFYRGS
jgi:hypothetical protein